jgi:hypothetical protein
MSIDQEGTDVEQIEVRIQQVGRYSRFLKAGLGVILGAFLHLMHLNLVKQLRKSQSAESQTAE